MRFSGNKVTGFAGDRVTRTDVVHVYKMPFCQGLPGGVFDENERGNFRMGASEKMCWRLYEKIQHESEREKRVCLTLGQQDWTVLNDVIDFWANIRIGRCPIRGGGGGKNRFRRAGTNLFLGLPGVKKDQCTFFPESMKCG
jgi:hypothetical protein